ncbi:MAG: NUDIX domain-containing protein [Cyclobacteriaceae bacterium]
MTPSVQKIYGNRVRVRACGLCADETGLLMVNHAGLKAGEFWAPPGGGIEFNESATDCLVREFAEETGIEVKVGNLLFVCEYRNHPLHAIELFFEVFAKGGTLRTGFDPEMRKEDQIIRKAKYLNWEYLKQMDQDTLHGAFKYAAEPSKIIDLRGYFKL